MFRRVFASGLFVALLSLACPQIALASSGGELVRTAREHEAAREDDIAARQYTEAIAIDPSCADAYLGLGALRARHGDDREAERVYSMALSRIPDFTEARLARARVRWSMGARDLALVDVDSAAAQDVSALVELASWYASAGERPAELAVWRRVYNTSIAAKDDARSREARAHVRALQIMVGECDPTAAANAGNPVRRAIAKAARLTPP